MAKANASYPKSDLYRRGAQLTYTGRNLDEIAFPLGGIGTGMVSLGGWGQLRDWEIKNRPAKGRALKNAFFAVSVRKPRAKVKTTRVLQGPVGGTYTGNGHSAGHLGGEGFVHFEKCAFRGEFPIGHLSLRDDSLPIDVELEAFNPFIPLEPDDSSVPVAILSYTVTNTSRSSLEVELFGNLSNCVGLAESDAPYSSRRAAGMVNRAQSCNGAAGIYFENPAIDPSSSLAGSMAIAALGKNVTVCASWPDDSVAKLWQYLAEDDFPPPPPPPPPPTSDAKKRTGGGTGTVRAAFALGPGASETVTFLIAWHFPNFQHWKSCDPTDDDCRTSQNATWKNWYATRWGDAWEVIEYVARDFERLRGVTCDFHDALFSSTLPVHVLDAVSANISILKSPTCLRLTDGTFYAFEGCGNTAGCCEGSCTHVWNYAQAHAYLFPSLARSQREVDYRWAQRRDGFGQFRLPLPAGTKGDFNHPPAADGQMGSVVQVYREWLISGDTEWLEKIWPATRRSLEFAWKYWDADRDGVMEGLQHNTYDIEYYGPNTLCGSLYLGALRAGEEMARIVGDDEAADEYARLFKKGSNWTDRNLFNDRFYVQDVRPEAAENLPAMHRKEAESRGVDDRFDWPRYQVGRGCLSDQLLGQWYATMLGLGYLYKRANVRKALSSIFKHNWRKDLHDHPALFRLYALGHEAGLIICTWPDGGRPGYPSMYADEVWCGIEYQVASHLVYEGFVDEGLSIVKGVRDRHRGDRRNPWDEFECGHHYARSMASWGVLLALSGFSCNAAEGKMGFAPRVFEENFRTFWSTGSAWGVYSQKLIRGKWTFRVEVKRGSLSLGALGVATAGVRGADVSAKIGSRRIEAGCKRRRGGSEVVFPERIVLEAGEMLRVVLK